MEPTPESLGLEVQAEPDPKSLGLETEARSTASTGEPDPKTLGLEMSPESMGLETTGRGSIGKAWDSYRRGANTLGGVISSGWDDLKQEFNPGHPVGDVIQSAKDNIPYFDDVADAAKTGTNKLFNGLGNVVIKSDRIGGTILAAGIDAAAGILQNDSINLIEQGRQRDLQEGLTKPNETSFDSLFPVRLQEDIGVPLGQKPTEMLGAYLQGSNSKTTKEIGEVISGLAPGVGMASGLLTSLELDPLSVTKFGTLTEAGLQAEKAGQLETGVARQIENSQRNIMEFRLGGILHPEIKLGGTTFGEFGPKVINKASNVMAMAEMAHLPTFTKTYGDLYPLQWVRNYMSRTSLIGVNNLVEERLIEGHGIEFAQKRLYEGATAKAMSLGLDLESPTVRSDIYKYFDNPTSYKGSVAPEKAAQLFNYLDGELKNEVALTRQSGIAVPEKIFNGYSDSEIAQMKQSNLTAAKNLEIQAEHEALSDASKQRLLDSAKSLREEANLMSSTEDFSTRYVPRGSSPSKMQAYLASKQIKEVEDGQRVVQELEGLQIGTGKKSDSFQRIRSLKTREAMNAEIESQTGVKEFFHDNPIQAYGDKIAALKQARMDKKFVSGLLTEFATTNEGYVQSILNSKDRVAASELGGWAPNHDDLIMSKLDPSDTTMLARLPENARLRLKAISALSPELQGAEHIKLPGIVGDYVGSVLSRPDSNMLKANMLAFQNLTKSAMFANPGFLLRHAWRMVSRGMAVDVSLADNLKSFWGITKQEGPWGERLPLFFERSKALGLASPTELAAETASSGLYEEALNAAKKAQPIKVTDEMLKAPNALSQAQSAIREMGASGKYKGFLSDLRNSMKDGILDRGSVIRNNPVFRVSSMLTQNAELMPKFAYFNKLIDAGYDADLAMQKTNRVFMNFEQMRTATRNASMVVPFANFMVKNTESLFEIMAQNPRNFASFGRNGSFQRALENWSGWNPEKTNDYRENFGGAWANDMILLPVMPGHDVVMSEKDWLKKTMFNWFSQNQPDAQGKPINQTEGAQLWLRLPSNSHALSMLNPLQLADEMGPMVKMGLALVTGVDPFTNAPIPGNGTIAQTRERAKVAMGELSRPFVPQNTVNAARGMVQQLWPSYEKSLLNMGFPDGMLKTLMGDKTNDKFNKDVSKALSSVKSLWVGGATQMDLDVFFRTQAQLHQSSQYLKTIVNQAATGKRPDEDIDRAVNVMVKTAEKITNMLDVKTDYDAAIMKAKSVTTPIELDTDQIKSDTDLVPEEQEAPQEGGDREPQSTGPAQPLNRGPAATQSPSEGISTMGGAGFLPLSIAPVMQKSDEPPTNEGSQVDIKQVDDMLKNYGHDKEMKELLEKVRSKVKERMTVEKIRARKPVGGK